MEREEFQGLKTVTFQHLKVRKRRKTTETEKEGVIAVVRKPRVSKDKEEEIVLGRRELLDLLDVNQ